MYDCLIIGGGIVGLSLARELAQRQLSVCVIERAAPGRAASWAGAGMLPPAKFRPGDPPANQLAALSYGAYPGWTEALCEDTGVDVGFCRCGALAVARDEDARRELEQRTAGWSSRGIVVESLSRHEIGSYTPALSPSILAASYLPEFGQVRNPRLLKALLMACHRQGVEVRENTSVHDFEFQGGRLVAVHTHTGRIPAERFCLAAGCWSGGLAERMGFQLPVRPVRGQIVLLSGSEAALRHIVEEGSRYVVPRLDGRVLIGSTTEDVGFDRNTTAEGISDLLGFATQLVPALGRLAVEKTWAGLRPSSIDGLPYLAQAANTENVWIATGHYRRGVELAPGTAIVMSRLMRDEPAEIDLAPFRLGRDVSDG